MKLYGEARSNDAIAANAYHDTFVDRELPGYLELWGVMVIPDYDHATGVSNLEACRILVDDRQILYDLKCNYYYNMCPWTQIHPGRRPLMKFEPTVKINKGRELILRMVAGPTPVSRTYWVRPVGVLYTDEEVRTKFGIDNPEDFEILPGGISQGPSREEPFLKFSTNAANTKPGEWYDLEDLSFRIYAHQELEIIAIGCVPHANQDKIQIANIDRMPVATERPFVTRPDLNELPWGNAWQDAGPYTFPEDLRPLFTDDFVRIQVKDNGTSIPAGGVKVWVKGIWRVRGG